jgi:acetyltransferase-like isoleucine patch superfamily enzyme
MISHNWKSTTPPFRVLGSTLIGIPSPGALRADKFPGVRLGSNPLIGTNCVIFANVFLGNNFQCGNNVLIRERTSIGDNVSIGDRSFIDTDVSIANGVTIKENVHVPSSTTIGDRVFVGPDVMFLEESCPPGFQGRKARGVIFEDDCSIGANVVLFPGVRVGSGACVAAGTIVTLGIPARYYASGSPVRLKKIDT